MAQKTKEVLKGYFKTGMIPTQANFEDLIDSVQEKLIAGTNIELTPNVDGTVQINSESSYTPNMNVFCIDKVSAISSIVTDKPCFIHCVSNESGITDYILPSTIPSHSVILFSFYLNLGGNSFSIKNVGQSKDLKVTITPDIKSKQVMFILTKSRDYITVGVLAGTPTYTNL